MTTSQPMQGNSTSTVLGRRLGGELIKLRTAASLTQTHAAKALTGSTTKVAKMEGGWVPVRDPDIRALCELYGVSDPAIVGGLLELARVDRERRKAKGWWNEFPNLGDMQEYVALESAATAIKAWQLTFVPGLLQTPDYIRALRDDAPSAEGGDHERFVAARLARQRRLDESPQLSLRAVVYEAALRNLIGGADVMREQLDHLADVAGKPSVSLRVLPFSTGARHGMNCTFNIISFSEPGAMDVVYMEVPFNRLWVEGGEAAAQYDELFERIATRAHNERDSLELISRLSREL
ncbi:helix-turn-helix transcriptional regulator [Streptomyces sp. NBRC 110028]|uniref:helix-turn-helix domain-containing protein n=1 Tax=Streptomyces sp. NBRC 110028 TaxID=1621260 RepID=UPI001F2C5C5D|nr:helix-turn-helix transcriptional regulator [Streptomyces sp. NBRC 110028]